MILYCFCASIICSIVYSAANETQSTQTPQEITTTFYTSTAEVTGQTFVPTPRPTLKPSPQPSFGPSDAPTANLGKQQALVTLEVEVKGLTKTQAEANRPYFLGLCMAIFPSATECEMLVTSILDTLDALTRRRLAEEIGVKIEYLIVIPDAAALNEFEASVSTGDFADEFQEGLDDNFEGVTVDKESISFEQTLGDGDDFLGKEEETFADKIASPYILLGCVCILVGTIWLLFLRSNIEYKNPTYYTQGQGDGAGVGNTQGPNAVEMGTIATAKSNSSD